MHGPSNIVIFGLSSNSVRRKHFSYLSCMRTISSLILCFFLTLSQGQNSYVDSISVIIRTTESDSIRCMKYLDLLTHFQGKDNERSKLYLDSASQVMPYAGTETGQGYIEYFTGQLKRRTHSIEAGIPHLRKSAKIFESLGKDKMLARASYAVGQSYMRLSAFDSAGIYVIASQRIYETLNDSFGLSNALSVRGIIHRRMGQLDESLRLYEEAARVTPDRHHDGVVNNLINRAIVLKNKGDIEAAIAMYLDAERESRKRLSPTSDAFAFIYGNMSSAYYEMEDYQNALVFGEKSLNLRRGIAPNDQMANALLGVALTSIELNDFQKAQTFLEEAKPLAGNNHYLLKDIYLAYGKISQRTGNLNKALDYLELAQEHKDSLFKIQVARQVEELETKYEVEQKEKDLALASTEKALAEAKLNGSRNFNMALIMCILLLGAFIFWLNRLNKKIKKGAEEKETLLKEIHHRVKNNLQVISALLTLQARHIKDDRARVALKEGQDRVESMALIHRNLYQFDNLKGVNTQEYLDKLLENLLSSYQTDTMQIELNTDIDSIWLDVDTMIPLGLTINELVSNALKHAFKNKSKGQIYIALKDLGDNLHLTIKDDGDGVQDLENFTDSSFGYSLINSFARKLSADLTFKNEDGFTLEMLIHSFQRAEKAA